MTICRNCGHSNSDTFILTDLNNKRYCRKCGVEMHPI